MSNLLIELTNRYFSRYPYVKGDVVEIICEVGLSLEVGLEVEDLKEVCSIEVSNRSKSCSLILLLIVFVENDKSSKRKLLNYLRNFMCESKLMQPNISEYIQFVCISYNNLVNFVVENMTIDINTDFHSDHLDLDNKEENQLLIEKYTHSVQFILNDVFEMLVSSAGLYNKEILRSDYALQTMFDGIYNLDMVLKRVLIYLFHIQTSDFTCKITSFINETDMKKTIDHYFVIDQQLLLCVTSILNRIYSIVICFSNSFSNLMKYIKILFNDVLDQCENGKLTKKVINNIFYGMLFSNSLSQFNKDLITSIGMLSALLYISEQITDDYDKTNDLYLYNMNKIVKNVEEHVIRCKFSNVCQMAFYRGLVLCCSMINDIDRLKNPIYNYEVFKISFHTLAYLINDYRSDEESAYGLQSLVVWISRFKYEVSKIDKTSINLSIPFFYLIPISDIVLSFLDQPINYHSKLANQILEEFVDYLLVLDSIFEQDIIEEINSDPLNWFMNLLFNHSFNNNKYRFLSLNILFNGILNHLNNHKFKIQFSKFNRVVNIGIDELEFAKLDRGFVEIQLIYYLVYSLSIQNISSSSQNLILAWFNLRRKILLEEKINNGLEDNLFLDFILFVSIQIIKRDNINYNCEKKELITPEGKSNMLTRLLQILKKADGKYYYEKLPLIFDSFFEETSSVDNVCCMEFNFTQVQILIELKRSECLLWEYELEVGDHLINNLGLVVIFNNSKKKPYSRIHGNYFIKSLTSNNSITLSHILELLSLSIKFSDIKKLSKTYWLINEMECLYIIICNIKPLNICSGVLSRTISIFGQSFMLIKKILLNKNFPLKIKDIYNSWLHKIFNFLSTSIGLQISSDKVDLYLPIFRVFLENFCLEDLNENLFDYSNYSNKYIFNLIIPNLQSQLFSSSNESKSLVTDLIINNSKFNTILDKFHYNIIQPQNLHSFNRTLLILKKLFKMIRPREYFVSNVLLYYYLKKLCIDLENQREDILTLLKSLFNFSNFEIAEKFNNIYFFLSELISLELIARIQNFCYKNFDVNILIFGNNRIPLQSIINLLGISFVTEFIYNSANNFKLLCGNSLKFVYLFTLLLFILSDSKLIVNFPNKFLIESNNRIDCSEQFYNQYLNQNCSITIEEICNLMKIILARISMDSMFQAFQNKLSLFPGNIITSNIHLNSFLNRIYIAFMSEKFCNFFYQLCMIYIDFIFKCDHPGNSENLLEIFSAILNSLNTNLFENSFEKQSKNKSYKLPMTKISVLINNETAQTLNDFILMNSWSTLNKTKIQNEKDDKSFLNKEQTNDLPKNLLLHILYSLLTFDELGSDCDNYKFNYEEFGDFTLDYEKIDDIFFQLIGGNTKFRFNEQIKANLSYDPNELFLHCGNLNSNLQKLYIPHPKRKSNNLCKLINILVSITIRDSKFHKSIKYVIKLLIIASLNMKLFNGITDQQDYDSDGISFQHYKCSIHSNHILAALISKSKSGSGTNNLCGIFDLSLLCGSLFSALNNIKMYDFKVKDENGFTLCNSSLNLMSALLKRFSFKANGIESNIEGINRVIDQYQIFNTDFKTSTGSNDLPILFNKVFKDVLSITLNMQFDSNFAFSLISEINTSARFSLKSIKRISGVFEPCIVDVLLNSTDTQFQGMVLLLLSEISISWLDCSYELAICIIKSIYSNSYFVRIHSSKLLGEIILRTLNIPNLSLYPLNEISSTNLDKILFNIFIKNSNNQSSKVDSLLNLIFQSIEFSINNSEVNKYNLIHGILNLGTNILKKLKNQSCLAFIELIDCSIYENLLLLVVDGFKEVFKHSILRIAALELMSLLFELEFSVNQKFKCLENLIYYWKNSNSISDTSYLEFSNLNNKLFLCMKHSKNFFNENLSEPIYLIKIIVNTFKYIDSAKLSSLICLSPTFDKIIHPKILFEFYSSIIEILSTSPETNDYILVKTFFNLICNNLKSIKHLISVNNKAQSISKKVKFRKILILTELVNVLIGCLSFIGYNNKLSLLFLDSEQSYSTLESIFDLIYNQELSEHKINEPQVKNSHEKTDFNLINTKINSFFLKDQILILEFSIFFVRFYKNITRHDSIPYVNICELEKIVFDKILKMVYNNIYDGTQITLEKKYLICRIIQTIFESMETELFLGIKIEKNDRIKKLHHLKIGISDLSKGTILFLLCLNHNYWYNLMVCLIYLITDEAASIENKAILIFNSFKHIIKYFCNNFLQKNENFYNCELNCDSNYQNSIEQIILLNDQNSCLFSIIILDVISSSLESMETKNNSVFFPREIDNICNEYLNISQIATTQIFKYFETINQISLHTDEISKIELYFEQWETQIKNKINLFERVYNCVRECPSQLICIELFGSVLTDEISILTFVISIRKLSIISKYMKINNKENIFEDSIFEIGLFEEHFDFLLFNINEKK
ncbi:uncharacterized protein ELE39_001597 [Cryptosporidium sp. chipmunk genotype I]|uniref:uncharacterized protein n=1 Tax=Cryptosporidium sp. chipmunk genotype I TaxID=1280935 RepID=UPI003519E504|nr:hypothetical protein ELE39_001597 [Cryptosporidium sp. chipmunk genotype I]